MPIDIPLGLETGGLRDDLDDANQALEEWKNSIDQETHGAAEKFAVVVEVIQELADKLRELKHAAEENLEAEHRLEETLRRVGDTAGWSAEELEMLAEKHASLSDVAKSVAYDVENVALKFDKIRGDRLEDVVRLSLDLASSMGGSATAAAEKLAKALQDPTGALEYLRDLNIELSDAETLALERMAGLGDVAGAQEAIIKKLDATVGGASQRTKTWSQVSKSIDEVLTGVTETILDALAPALESILPLLEAVAIGVEKVVDWALSAESGVLDVAQAIYGGLKVALEWLIDAGIVVFTYFQVVVENWSDLCRRDIMRWQLAIITAANIATHIFTVALPEMLAWFGRNWKQILYDIGNGTATIFKNMAANVWEFIKGVTRALAGDPQAFKFHSLLEGFELTLKEMPKISKRIISDEEVVLQEAIDGINDQLNNRFTSAFIRNRENFYQFFSRENPPPHGAPKDINGPKPLPPEEETDPEADDPKKKKEKEEKKKKEQHARATREKREKDQESEGGVEDLQSLAGRIQGAAAANRAEERSRALLTQQVELLKRAGDAALRQVEHLAENKAVQAAIATGQRTTNAILGTIADALEGSPLGGVFQ